MYAIRSYYGENTKNAIKEASDYLKHSRNVYLTGSGTSYNASLVAKYLLSKYAKIKSESIISSELQFAPDSLEPNSIVIAISQSGESADVLEAVNIAKKNDCKIISIIVITSYSIHYTKLYDQ